MYQTSHLLAAGDGALHEPRRAKRLRYPMEGRIVEPRGEARERRVLREGTREGQPSGLAKKDNLREILRTCSLAAERPRSYNAPQNLGVVALEKAHDQGSTDPERGV